MTKKIRWILPLLLWAVLPLSATEQMGAKPREKEQKEEARMVLSTTEHDFGMVNRRGGDLQVTFRFRNEGETPLVLMRVITSCSCLKSHFSKRPVPAGEWGEITLTYEPLKADPGVFNKVVQILSNSASGREIITIRGNSIDKKRNQDEE